MPPLPPRSLRSPDEFSSTLETNSNISFLERNGDIGNVDASSLTKSKTDMIYPEEKSIPTSNLDEKQLIHSEMNASSSKITTSAVSEK